jgi:hypothetical protein
MTEMNGNEDRLAVLGKALGYDEWGKAAPAERVFVWRFFLGGGELPGWRLHRSYRIPGDGFPPGVQAVWTRDDGALLQVDAFEAPSAAEARRTLLAVAGEHEADGAVSRAQAPVGEVAVAGPRESTLALVRGNLVLQLRNAGGLRESVRPYARQLDALVAGGADANGASATVRSGVVRGEELAALAGRVLSGDGAGEAPRAWFRFRTTAGEVVLEDGRPVYRAAQGAGLGDDAITVEVVQPATAAAGGLDLDALGLGR